MAGELTAGIQSGASGGPSFFGSLLSEINKGQARRFKEDQVRKKEDFDLKKAIGLLEQKNVFDKTLAEEKGKQDRLTDKAKFQLKAGRPLGEVLPSFLSQQGQQVSGSGQDVNALLETAGLNKNSIVTEVDGEQFIRPETLQQEKLRKQVKKLDRDISGETARQAADIEVEKQVEAQEAKEAAATKRKFFQAKEKLKLTHRKFREARDKTQKVTGFAGSGRLGGALTSTLGFLGFNDAVKTFKGDLSETATAIAKIAAPSAKVGPDLIDIFEGTLPEISFFQTSTDAEANNQVRTSITNGFINFVSTHPEDFPDPVDFVAFEEEVGKMLEEGSGTPSGFNKKQSIKADRDRRARQEAKRRGIQIN